MLNSLAGSGGFLGPASRRHFPINSCFATKENKFGVGLKVGRPQAKQQGPGSQSHPRPSLAYGDKRARGEKGKRCFAEQGCIGALVCSPRRVYLSSMQLSECRFEPWVRWGLRAEVESWFGGIAGACAQNAFSSQLLLFHEGEVIWSGFPAQETTSKAEGPREPGQPRPSLAYGDPRARGEKGQRCFAE